MNLPRPSSPSRPGVRSRERGITLTELLIVLAVVAIIILVVVPAFVEWMRAYRVRTAAHQVQAELRLARNVAVALNSSVSVRFRRGEALWTDAQGRERRFTLPPGVAIANLLDPVDGDMITFLNNGRVADAGRTLLIDGWVHDDVHHQYTVSLTAAGKVSAERDTVTVSLPGGGGGGGEGGGGGDRLRR